MECGLVKNINSVFINDGLNQSERLERLNTIAISQMKILTESNFKNIEHIENSNVICIYST